MRHGYCHIFAVSAALISAKPVCEAFQIGTPYVRSLTSCQLRLGRSSTNDDNHRQIFAEIPSNIRRGVANICGTAILFTSVLATPAWALTENQQFVSDVWWAVTTQYYDPTFNGLTEDGWRAKKNEAILGVAKLGPDDDKDMTDVIQKMISALGDPYTRYLPREKFESLTAYARGGSTGIGVQLLLDPRSNSVVVMSTSEDGPAALSGIKRGDAIVEVNGENMEGATAELVAAKCRGEPGSNVEVVVCHGVFDDETGETKSQKNRIERLTITRAKVKVNPVTASTFTSSDGRKFGLIKVPSFSQETPGQVVDALRYVKSDGGVNAIAIDLRGNVGGFMPAGVDTSKLFLAGGRRIIFEVNRSGQGTAYYADGIGAEMDLPLYLVVDGRTASAAEIFSAALQDNRRALVVGSQTFGKGRIQNVQSIGNGNGVAVTRARYVTPRGRDLQGVGITPNKESLNCGPNDSAAICLDGIV
uniref:PDZ domain-containing protein n=1 Tax=Odontella aurita TaxID=265563 RepID=A0A7S4MBC2_9STRA|mmetsp:Transcript_16608/g.47833  ORF Transcript_16608/g.47833 Transcript_16608/m.47833 type:complete len:474 (+) Transcript_16608:128-1549(+)